MIVTVTKFETCPANSQHSHLVGYRVEHDSADPSGMGFPLYQEFDSYIPRSLVTETMPDKEIVKVGLELITSKIDDFVQGTQCNMGSSFTKPIIGETFQYPLAKGDDRETPSIKSVVSLLGKISSDGLKPYTTPLLNKDQRRALILKAAGSGLVRYPVNGSESCFSYTDAQYSVKCHIAEEDGTEYNTQWPPSLFVQVRAKDGVFMILVDTANSTLNIMAPNPATKTRHAFESGLSQLETELITSILRHIRIAKVHVLYHVPRNLQYRVEDRFNKALSSFVTQIKEFQNEYIKVNWIEVWSDMIDKYFKESSLDRM
jgi:hypothetical protein